MGCHANKQRNVNLKAKVRRLNVRVCFMKVMSLMLFKIFRFKLPCSGEANTILDTHYVTVCVCSCIQILQPLPVLSHSQASPLIRASIGQNQVQ